MDFFFFLSSETISYAFSYCNFNASCYSEMFYSSVYLFVYLSLMPLQWWSLHQRICQNFSPVLQSLVTLLVSNPTISLLQIYNYFANQCTCRCLLVSCLHPKPKVKYLMDFFSWYFILSKEEHAQGWRVLSLLYIC